MLKADRKDKTQNIEEYIEELETIIEGSFDGMLVTDGEGNVLLINESYVRNTGIQREEIVGHNVRDLINPVWMKKSVAALAIEQREPVSMHHTTKEGKNIMVTGRPVIDRDGKIRLVVVNSRDLTEIYSLKEELIKSRKIEEIYFEQMNNDGEQKSKLWNADIVIADDKMREIYALAKKISNFDATVLISGESGVGKELLARFIHGKSELRREKHFIDINCGAIPETLLESELFGYEEGAFTGAAKNGKKGFFELAHGGTLFLDEIGEMSLNMQVKLLRVLETKMIRRVGGEEEIPIDVRILAATNRDLSEMVKKEEFREDLFYRLNVISVYIPPLRERKEEIIPLSLRFLKQFNDQYGQDKRITYEVFNELKEYKWEGNARQLRNVIENMVVVSNNDYLQLNDLPWIENIGNVEEPSTEEKKSLSRMMENYEKSILMHAKSKYKTSRKVAEALKVDQSTIVRKFNKYSIE